MSWKNKINPKNIEAIDVFLEKRKTRTYVGRLRQTDRPAQGFKFCYDKTYLDHATAFSLGPGLPLTQSNFSTKKLFPFFVDRIPDPENVAYKEYCISTGISPNEKNPIILLATIGKRGPSAFVFEPVYKESFGAKELRKYRKYLGLTLREFAAVFQLSYTELQRIESNKKPGRDTLKKIEIYVLFPNVALFEIHRYGGVLHKDKRQRILTLLKKHA